MTTQTQSVSTYINMHAQGLGYLSRVRNVTPRKGSPFMACSINAMFGEKGKEDGIQYTPFDVRAVNAEVTELLGKAMADANNPDVSVMVRFRIGDFYPDTYRLEVGPKAGEMRTVLKGRLLMITHLWVKVKGSEGAPELKYQRPDTKGPQNDASSDEFNENADQSAA
jgi:Protein of unknown function (DUF3577)